MRRIDNMRIGIIGAGASGLLLATKLEKLNIDYMLFNKGKIGRKILASGNGKCNISNEMFKAESYHHNPLALNIVSNHQKELFDYFKELHIYTKKDDEGRMYPISESSLSVLNILLKNINKKVIDIEVDSIKKHKDEYYINEGYGPFDKIVICTGSIASYKRPYNNYDYLSNLGITIKPFSPSLVGFTTNRKIKILSGVRQKAMVHLYQKDKLIHSEYGEVILKDNGISGIVILNMSSYYNHLESKANCYLDIDFSYQMDFIDNESILNPKLYEYMNENHIQIHHFQIPITGLYDFEFAQVCSGGVKIDDINMNLRLKKDSNIFLAGEILDVDGLCGGYNLMFSFCCALEIAKEIKNEI